MSSQARALLATNRPREARTVIVQALAASPDDDELHRIEQPRVRRAELPVQAIKLASILVLFGMLGLSFVFDSGTAMLLALPAAGVWYFLAPPIWRRAAARL